MNIDDILRNLPVLFAALLAAILFIQSGLDKVIDWSGNLEWLTGHFSKTPFAGYVPILLAIITVKEILTGLISVVGLIYFFATGSLMIIFYGAALGAATLIALFFGQRIAKDYPGAVSIIPYFIIMLVLMILSSPIK